MSISTLGSVEVKQNNTSSPSFHNLHFTKLAKNEDKSFLAVQDSSIGDLVTHSLSESDFLFQRQ